MANGLINHAYVKTCVKASRDLGGTSRHMELPEGWSLWTAGNSVCLSPCLALRTSSTCEYVTLQDRRDIADAIKILPSALGIPLDVSQVLQDLEPSSFFYIWHMLWPPQAPGLSSCSSSKSCGDTILFCCMHSGDVTYFIWEFLTLAQISKEFSNVFILKKSAYKCTRLQDQGSTVPHSQVSEGKLTDQGNFLPKETQLFLFPHYLLYTR
ncbi:uncharacterized protein LOC123635533 isoform X2 [Lemur catta]|uniref:uncharacterized protein LOC123635533 isoform X2 n=1 Tax=Lemur catta TaxID=9447 RepID=UPI001E269882|nr:uncharacterized protein LOC123635533 isoform X2 [Lemur catta]